MQIVGLTMGPERVGVVIFVVIFAICKMVTVVGMVGIGRIVKIVGRIVVGMVVVGAFTDRGQDTATSIKAQSAAARYNFAVIVT